MTVNYSTLSDNKTWAQFQLHQNKALLAWEWSQQADQQTDHRLRQIIWQETKFNFLMNRLFPYGNIRSHFTKVLWVHNPNLVIIGVAFTWKMIITSGHNFAHVTTAKLCMCNSELILTSSGMSTETALTATHLTNIFTVTNLVSAIFTNIFQSYLTSTRTIMRLTNKRPVGLYSPLLIQIIQYCNKCLHVDASKTGWTPK